MYEPTHEIMARFVLRKLIFQMRMHSHLVGLDVRFLVGPFDFFHTSCVRTAKALARLRGCEGSPEPSLVAYVISTIISCAGSFYYVSKTNTTFYYFSKTNTTTFVCMCLRRPLIRKRYNIPNAFRIVANIDT